MNGLKISAQLRKYMASDYPPDRRKSQRLAGLAADELDRLEADNTRLRAMMLEAAEDIADWGAYADEYYRVKWALPDDIEKYKNAAKGIYPEPEPPIDVDKFIADAVARSETNPATSRKEAEM